MPANSNAQPALEDAIQSATGSSAKMDQALEEFRERAGKVAQETLNTLKSRAETLKGHADTLRTRAEPYVSDAGEKLAVAERYIVERVQKQPLTSTLAVLGVGVLIGLVLASGRSSR
jgi:ElaB/YqjD/DUF883 family membrane-anchored ribosome-binding protein